MFILPQLSKNARWDTVQIAHFYFLYCADFGVFSQGPDWLFLAAVICWLCWGGYRNRLIFLYLCMLFLQLLSTFTWNPREIQKILVNCFLDAFLTPWYNISVILTTPYDWRISGAPHGVRVKNFMHNRANHRTFANVLHVVLCSVSGCPERAGNRHIKWFCYASS